MRHITIALLIPSAIHSAGLKVVLRHLPDMSVSVKDVGIENAFGEIGSLRPSLMIVDPVVSGIDWSYFKDASSSPVKIIALLSHQMPKSLLSVFDETISVYDSPDNIVKTICKTLNQEKKADKSRELSPREKEVVRSIVKGLSNKEIAETMHVSVNTVMTHRRNIASKLHIHTPAGLTIYAIVAELVSLDDVKSDVLI